MYVYFISEWNGLIIYKVHFEGSTLSLTGNNYISPGFGKHPH